MRSFMLYILCGLISYAPLFAFSAKTDNNNSLKTAYVSINETVRRTGEQNKIRKLLEAEQKRIQVIIRKKSTQFNKQAQKIRQEMVMLSEEEKVKKYESMQKMQMIIEKFVKEKELVFQKKEAQLRVQVGQKIKKIIEKVAKKEKVDIVHNKDNILWVTPSMDFTNKVIAIYKKTYK